tara:strand:- start:1313 stop:2176 length:864 start_codon:yes stop_codon:yes gene_type:complete
MSLAEMSMNDKVSLLKELYHEIAGKGQDGDTMLAHINPEEALLLKAHGGSGTINPNTGLPEYKKAFKKILPIAIAVGVGYATGGFGAASSGGAWGSAGGWGSIGTAGVSSGGLFSGLSAGTLLQGAGLLSNVAGTIQSKKYANQQAGFQRDQVAEQNKADQARNKYNQLLQKRSRLSSMRQGRIEQGKIEGQMGALGTGGTSSYAGSVGSIGTQTSANLGNINVAENVGNQITGYNTAAANFGSQANTAGSKSGMWTSVSTIGGTFLEQGDKIAGVTSKISKSIFGV